MAVVPVSGTNIRILIGVPFQSDYRHTRWFDSDTAQRNYFQSKSAIHTIAQANFQRDQNGRTFVKVNKAIEGLRSANYLMFQNEEYNDKWFYAFVTRLEYINAKVTNVHFQLDVFQTWRFEVQFKPSFIVREHCPLWNSDGSPVINTIDEGLAYGTEYENIATVQYVPNGGYKWLVIVSKEPLHGDNSDVTPTIIGTPQPLSYYLVPFKDDDMTPSVLLPGGEGDPITPPTQIMKQLYKNEKAVNNIVSLYVTDYTGIPTTYKAGSDNGPDVLTFPNNGNKLKSVVIPDTSIYLLYVEKVVDFKPINTEIFSDKYSNFKRDGESKLLMYPYVQIVMDDFKGNRVVYKPEYVAGKNFDVNVKGSLGTSNKVSYNVPDYNHSSTDGQRGLTSNESALINNNASDLPIINDYLAAYLQGNRNAIENQKNSIVWNGIFGALGSISGGAQSVQQGSLGGVLSNGMGLVQGGGNVALQLQGIEAKQADIANIPPQIVKMGSNTSYDYGNGYNGVFVMKKQIKPEYRKILSDFFNMYGYKVNQVKTPNFHTRRYWNYVQTAGLVVTGNLNNEDLNEFKSVFDNGITLWHTDDIGNYSLNNEVI